MTAIAASSRCTPTSCSTSTITISRKRSSSRRRISASTSTPSSRPTTGARSSAEYKKIVEKRTGKPFPQEPREQLWGAIGAVFGSWMNQRAITYRRLHPIPESWGTAVNVQAMVFGNMGEDCATGVAFTRDPSTGANLFYGEYLVNAQGEDVVAGIRTPQHLTVAGQEGAEVRRAGDGRGDAGGLQAARQGARDSSRSTTATCRTSSSPCSAASSTCCRRATASAPPRRRSRSPSTWCARA